MKKRPEWDHFAAHAVAIARRNQVFAAAEAVDYHIVDALITVEKWGPRFAGRTLTLPSDWKDQFDRQDPMLFGFNGRVKRLIESWLEEEWSE